MPSATDIVPVKPLTCLELATLKFWVDRDFNFWQHRPMPAAEIAALRERYLIAGAGGDVTVAAASAAGAGEVVDAGEEPIEAATKGRDLLGVILRVSFTTLMPAPVSGMRRSLYLLVFATVVGLSASVLAAYARW